MDVRDVAFCIAIGTAYIAATLGAQAIIGLLAKKKRVDRVQQKAGSPTFARRLLQKGALPLNPLACALLEFSVAKGFFSRLAACAHSRGFACDEQSVGTLCLAASAVIFVLGALIGGWPAGAAVVLVALVVASAAASHDREVREDAMREALPDALRAMGTCFHAGLSIQQTFDQMRSETQGSLSDMFARASDEIRLGEPVGEVLEKFRDTERMPELAFVSVALSVQHKTGGSLQQVLDSACESLESEIDLQRSLRVQTAQARLSARVVTGVTIALVAVLSLLSKDFLAPFFSSIAGMAMLCVALVMQVSGIVCVRRMLQVEVD